MKTLDLIMKFVTDPELEIYGSWVNKRDWCVFSPIRSIMLINFPLFITTVIVHEFLHCKHPDDSEEETAVRTQHLIERLTVKQIRAIAHLAAQKIAARVLSANAAKQGGANG